MMKKTFLQVAMLAVLTFAFASCGKEPEPAGGIDTTVGDSVPTDDPMMLVGTRWVRHVDETFGRFHLSLDVVLDFVTDSTGLEIYHYPEMNYQIVSTFVYSFDDPKGHYRITESEESPESVGFETDFTYNSKKNTLTTLKNQMTFQREEQ